MKRAELTLPDIAFVAGTRAMLGAGIALLLSNKLSEEQRKAIGWTLALVGAVATIPIVMNVFAKRQSQ